MLDLTQIVKKYYEIRLLDETVLKLKRPSQAMVEFLISIKNLIEKKEEEQVVASFAELFALILSNNTDGYQYEAEGLAAEYDFSTISYVIEDYFKYWNEEVADEVDFQ